ncbi:MULTISPECIES: hypothetical protein [unclassified Streptomyces]|uniref:hypothetical protein n=1 Tax=unclassified Streptomyces TaxID=2593676 RepID=UPI000C27E9AC|nr:hypothetical protein [Streptomyces sp. CB01201]PJN00248.1 hypothetical protein CG740_26445 [Streptomyces sp. CB01201]
MQSVQLAVGGGTSVFGVGTVLALCGFFFWIAAASGSSPWAWCLPAGMGVMGAGLLWAHDAWPAFVVPGGLLIAVGAFVIKGYREGALPRSRHKGKPKRSRPYKLPPL